MTHRIALIAGDGVGPEVTAEARKAVNALGVDVEWTEVGHPSVPDHIMLWGLLLALRQGLDLWASLRPA